MPAHHRVCLAPLLPRRLQLPLEPPQQRLRICAARTLSAKDVQHALADRDPTLLRAAEPTQAVLPVLLLAQSKDGGHGALGRR